MLFKPLRVLWGDLTSAELKKFGILSVIVALIIGNYWMLRTMKDAIFNDLVGLQWMPRAKLATIIVMIFVIFVFNKLVDLFEKHKLFYVFSGIYSALFFLIAFATANVNFFSVSETSVFFPYVSWIPGKFVGWLSYVTFESSVVLIILFWAFVNSMTKPESAKKGYAMLATCTQIGTITGSILVRTFVLKIGSPAFIALGGVLILCVPWVVKLYVKEVPKEEGIVVEKKKTKTGFFEGFKLIVSKPYVMGILIVSTIYEIVTTILEFQMKMIAKDIYVTRDAFASWYANFAISANVLALIFALVGTSFFMRKFGFRFCLLSYPTLVGVTIASVFIYKMFGVSNVQYMWALFAGMVAIKGFSYSLNNPTKEVMYLPTSKDVKFKAKSWIDSFGQRGSKGTGAVIADSFKTSLSALITVGAAISIGVVGVWLVVAFFLGKKFNKLQEENQIIE